jgi:para-aminobenzoate synthetase component I
MHIKTKMLDWVSRFNIFCFLDDHNYRLPGHAQECIAGAGASRNWTFEDWDAGNPEADWVFCQLGYGLKGQTLGVKGGPPDPIGFPDSFFFTPQYVLVLEGGELRIGSLAEDHGQVFAGILRGTQAGDRKPGHARSAVPQVHPRITRSKYIDTIEKLKAHIRRGDCYEINFCQEFYARDADLDPVQVYTDLAEISPNPFSALYRLHERYAICASPERFIRKSGNRITSQPIKGTMRRAPGSREEEEAMKRTLLESVKERSENVMVVDLVRNDLSMICTEGSVRVDELFGIYTFPQVYQMVSTISGELRGDILFRDIIRACYPMGSMTGAPKKRVLELIDRYESTGRGLFSGSVGYITPDGDLDLNVMIRSIFYDRSARYMNYLVGSGITFYCDPEKEYEECLLKSKAMQAALGLP